MLSAADRPDACMHACRSTLAVNRSVVRCDADGANVGPCTSFPLPLPNIVRLTALAINRERGLAFMFGRQTPSNGAVSAMLPWPTCM